MDEREIEVTVLSAQDLKNVKLSGGTMSPYVVAWIYPTMKVPSAVASRGGANPSWNSVVRLVCEEGLLAQGGAKMTIEIYHHGSFSNKLIGTVSIPLSDLRAGMKGTDQSGSSMPPIATTYEVRKPSGSPQGLLNVSLKVGKLVKQPQNTPWAVPSLVQADHYSKANVGSTTPMTAFPAAAGYPLGAGNQYNSPQQQYYSQPPPYTYQQGYAAQKPAKTRRSGFGGAGFGTGLLGGALGGMLLGSALDGGDGGGGCGGGCGA